MPNKRNKKPDRAPNINRRRARELYDDQGLLWTLVAHLELAEARELLSGKEARVLRNHSVSFYEFEWLTGHQAVGALAEAERYHGLQPQEPSHPSPWDGGRDPDFSEWARGSQRLLLIEWH